MNGRLTQPKVDGYIQWMRRNDPFGMTGQCYDAESCKLLDEFFALLRQIAPISQNGAKVLWLRAERGPIEDFGSIEDEIAEGNYETEDEFITEWKSWFPDKIKWYQLQAVEDEAAGYRAIMLRHSYVIIQDKHREPAGFPMEISELSLIHI